MTKKQNLIREKNITQLCRFLFEKRQALKAEMAEATALSVVTTNALVKELVAAGVIHEGESVQQAHGRPAVMYHFNYNQEYYLLLSIQDKKELYQQKLMLTAKIINMAGEEKFVERQDFSEVCLTGLIAFIEGILARGYPITRMALSIPGKTTEGTVLSSWWNLLNGWEIEKAVKQITEIPLVIQNDAHLLTVGCCLTQRISLNQFLVGIYYPEYSMPGISIYCQGKLLTGNNGLAGEGKFLPSLMTAGVPATNAHLVENLAEIIALYNVVIAPNAFIITSENVAADGLQNELGKQQHVQLQPNQPAYFFADDFETSLTAGLRALALEGTIYAIQPFSI